MRHRVAVWNIGKYWNLDAIQDFLKLQEAFSRDGVLQNRRHIAQVEEPQSLRRVAEGICQDSQFLGIGVESVGLRVILQCDSQVAVDLISGLDKALQGRARAGCVGGA